MNGKTMKNKPHLWTTLATVALGSLVATLTVAPDARAQAAAPSRLSDQLFARQIAGAYLVEVPAVGIKVLLKLSADGGTVRVSSADAGSGGSAPFASRTAALGNWKRTGDRAIQLVELEFDFDAAGMPMPLDSKVLVELSFAADWLTFSGTLKVLVYSPGSDLLDGEPVTILDEGRIEGRRVR